MATNDFLVFGGGAGANVITQVSYSGLAARTAGFSAGVAQSAQLNKVWRQSSIMAAVLAQFISDTTGQNAVDDGTTATLSANLTSAIQIAATGRLLGIRIFTGNTTYTPTAGTKSVVVEVVGGGGGGGGSSATGAGQISLGGGGGAGAYAQARFTTGFSGVAITVGTAGPAGAVISSGGVGGTSSFGALISAPGGAGGTGNGAIAPPFLVLGGSGGGPASGGNVAQGNGVNGEKGFAITSTNFSSGAGAMSRFGAGGGANAATAFGVGGSAYGTGGGGGATGVSASGQIGGAGVIGVVIVYEYA